jgi:hypothetical protein
MVDSNRSPSVRTGPLGRLVRGLAAAALAVLVAPNLATFVANGPARYRDSEVASNPLV